MLKYVRWQCHFPDRNTSTNIRWIVMTFHTDIKLKCREGLRCIDEQQHEEEVHPRLQDRLGNEKNAFCMKKKKQ